MNEKEFRMLVVKMLEPLAAFPVENSVHPGVPDICCSVGWIETKLGERQKREYSRVVIPTREDQRTWLRHWARTGARAWTLTLIQEPGDETWLLHTGAWAADNLGLVPIDALLTNAVSAWLSRPSAMGLVDALIGKRRT